MFALKPRLPNRPCSDVRRGRRILQPHQRTVSAASLRLHLPHRTRDNPDNLTHCRVSHGPGEWDDPNGCTRRSPLVIHGKFDVQSIENSSSEAERKTNKYSISD